MWKISKTQNLKMSQNSKAQKVRRKKTQKLNMWLNSKKQNVTFFKKEQNKKCEEKKQKKYQILIELISLNCD